MTRLAWRLVFYLNGTDESPPCDSPVNLGRGRKHADPRFHSRSFIPFIFISFFFLHFLFSWVYTSETAKKRITSVIFDTSSRCALSGTAFPTRRNCLQWPGDPGRRQRRVAHVRQHPRVLSVVLPHRRLSTKFSNSLIDCCARLVTLLRNPRWGVVAEDEATFVHPSCRSHTHKKI